MKRRNFGEADRILTIYTQDEGKISVIAKGVRRTRAKMVGHVELFYELNLHLAEGKNFETLCGAEIINEFANLRRNERLTNIAYLISEVLDSLTHENEKNPELYKLLQKALLKLDENIIASLLIPFFFYKVLQIQGHQPHTEVCTKCRKKLVENENYFSNQFGGVICTNCVNSDLSAQKISSDSIKLIRIFSHNPMEILDRINIHNDLRATSEVSPPAGGDSSKMKEVAPKSYISNKIEKELQDILINYCQYIIEKPIKSARFI